MFVLKNRLLEDAAASESLSAAFEPQQRRDAATSSGHPGSFVFLPPVSFFSHKTILHLSFSSSSLPSLTFLSLLGLSSRTSLSSSLALWFAFCICDSKHFSRFCFFLFSNFFPLSRLGPVNQLWCEEPPNMAAHTQLLKTSNNNTSTIKVQPGRSSLDRV